MEKTEALELLRSGAELTQAQRDRITEVLAKAEVEDDDEWNGSDDTWWSSSSC